MFVVFLLLLQSRDFSCCIRETPFFSPVFIEDSRIASSMAVYHHTIFCY